MNDHIEYVARKRIEQWETLKDVLKDGAELTEVDKIILATDRDLAGSTHRMSQRLGIPSGWLSRRLDLITCKLIYADMKGST